MRVFHLPRARACDAYDGAASYASGPATGNWALWVTNGDRTHKRKLTHPALVEPAGSGGDYPGACHPTEATSSTAAASSQDPTCT